jgi:hypothetical protein
MTKTAMMFTRHDLAHLRDIEMVASYPGHDGKATWTITTHGRAYIQEKSKLRWIKTGLAYAAELVGIAAGTRTASGF